MATSLKVLSLNIEASRHFDKFPQAIHAEDPDVLCLQEVCKTDLERISKMCGYPHYTFCKRLFLSEQYPTMEKDSDWGIALFAKEAFKTHTLSYRKAESAFAEMDFLDIADEDGRQKAMEGIALLGHFTKNGTSFTIGTVHFTWSLVIENPTQIRDTKKLLSLLKNEKDLLLCGDFNVPRGKNACYDLFTQHLTDAMPKNFTTTIDRSLHKHAATVPPDLLVDYFFHTKNYSMSDVRVIGGVSDHCAIVGILQK